MPIDEDAFLSALIAGLAPPGDELIVPPGDDCAAFAWGGEKEQLLLAAVDQVAADVHYYGREADAPTPPELAGRKLLARNLSDIAAMGGTPLYALLAIAATRDCPQAWAEAFARGVNELARESGTAMIGGDLTRGASDVASLTVLGRVERDCMLLRHTARPGDPILVTGSFGGSLASGRHLTFQPRLEEGRWLARHGAHTGIDASDGLLKDLERLCSASGVGAELMLDTIPRQTVDGRQVELQQALLDGEDYELIVALPPERLEALQGAWPFATPLTRIGTFRAGEPVVLDARGDALRERLGDSYDHFRG